MIIFLPLFIILATPFVLLAWIAYRRMNATVPPHRQLLLSSAAGALFGPALLPMGHLAVPTTVVGFLLVGGVFLPMDFVKLMPMAGGGFILMTSIDFFWWRRPISCGPLAQWLGFIVYSSGYILAGGFLAAVLR